MASISNIKIGRKIALVLAAIVLCMVGLSWVSFWGTGAIERLGADSTDRLMKVQLADKIAYSDANINTITGRMVYDKKVTEDLLNQVLDLRKTENAALEEFKAGINTPKAVQQGAEMTDMARAKATSNDHVFALIRAGRYTEANQLSRVKSGLKEKAKEASDWQLQLVDQNEKTRRETSRTIWTTLITGSLFAIAIAIIGGIVLTHGVVTPLRAVVNNLEQIALGDLSSDALPEFQTRSDEIGILARAMQKMIAGVRTMVREISGGIGVLANSSTELLSSSSQMTAGSHTASDKAHSVAASAEEMSSNIASVAAGMEQTTANLANVATATEQMTSTIGEIAGNSEKARHITAEATRQAARITEQINQLGHAAREIGKVTETITEISSQTNLLALNATIEAARAGSAGKGFAVVANEIKALAQQTAGATEDIKARITGVQAATLGGIAEIEKISHVIDEVSAIVTSIAAAIEEQATATKSIAGNIAEASLGVTDANKRMSETSQVSHEIARDIGGVDSVATEMASGSNDVRSSAAELSKVAETLRTTVSRFHV